jgi:hypothetical protein
VVATWYNPKNSRLHTLKSVAPLTPRLPLHTHIPETMGDSFDPAPSERNANGQFMRKLDAVNQDSIVSVIVNQEVDVFLARLKERLNSIDESELDFDEAKSLLDAKENVFQALNRRFGLAIAKQLSGKMRKVSGWNCFCKENFAKAKSDVLTEKGENLSILLHY